MNSVASIILLLSSMSYGEESCSKAYGCSGNSKIASVPRFILYDVNIGEGFNLKRDVYMRMAMFVRKMAINSKYDWHLVLPPWSKQWHWRKANNNISLRWHRFFDVFSLQLYSPVVEIDQYYADNGKSVDEVYVLQHFPEFYEWAGEDSSSMDWSERWTLAKCRDKYNFKVENGSYMFYQGKEYIKTQSVKCISFHGTSAYLESVIASTEAKSIMFHRAEIATHMTYGDSDYWMCRRSMRFAKHLVKTAAKFRATYLNSSDLQDRTVRPTDWREEYEKRSAIGGPYLGVHLRRRDFIQGRPTEIPSLDESVSQIRTHLSQNNLSIVFIASDMYPNEYEYIEKTLQTYNIQVIKFIDDTGKLKEGELAILDQIIASHAKVFVGTHESTFSYRIQEEREILGFPVAATFNRFCPSFETVGCTPPTKWLIQYPTEPIQDKNSLYLRQDDEL